MYIICTDNDIDGEVFLELAKDDLEKMNLKVGAILKLLKFQKVTCFNLHMYYKWCMLIITYFIIHTKLVSIVMVSR